MGTYARTAKKRDHTRMLLPGSGCLYLKLYCSENNCDYLLREVVAPFIAPARRHRRFRKWFFIRYADPDWHLRLRFFGPWKSLCLDVLPYFYRASEKGLSNKYLYSMEIATYERELERYGGTSTIDIAESMFQNDSDAVIALLELLGNNTFLDERWRIALVGADALLSNFGLDTNKKLGLMVRLCERFGAEFDVDCKFKAAVSRRFRAERQKLVHLLDRSSTKTNLERHALSILSRRTRRNMRITNAYEELLKRSSDTEKFCSVAESMVHMHLNRLLRSKQRMQEFVIYSFLMRLYRSTIARKPDPGAM